MDKKKICLIYEFLSEQGGLEREIINHANMLRDAGHDVKVLTCHFDKKILEQLPFGDIKIESIGPDTGIETLDLALCFLGFNKLAKYNPDLFLSYSFPSNYLIRNKKCKKVNYVNHFPHFLYLEGDEKKEWASGTQGVKRGVSVFLSMFLKDYLKRVDRRMISRNELIYMNSEFTKKRLDKLYKKYYKNGDSIISYPPLDPKFKPSDNKMKDKFVFSSSRIIPDKKYELLINAMKYMKNKIPLYVAGSVEDSYRKKLINLAARNNVKLKFVGRLNTQEIIDYYTNATIFAFPTPGEDFGLVPAESMACGTPVVVWGDGAGPTEQVVDGVTGYHAKPFDVKDYAKKMDMIIDKNLKVKNRKKIIDNAKRFSYGEIKKGFMKEMNKVV